MFFSVKKVSTHNPPFVYSVMNQANLDTVLQQSKDVAFVPRTVAAKVGKAAKACNKVSRAGNKICKVDSKSSEVDTKSFRADSKSVKVKLKASKVEDKANNCFSRALGGMSLTFLYFSRPSEGLRQPSTR